MYLMSLEKKLIKINDSCVFVNFESFINFVHWLNNMYIIIVKYVNSFTFYLL